MHLLTIVDLIARLHPALVHLPIGILLIAVMLQALSGRQKFAVLSAAVPVVLLAGLISAVLSCITGFLLFRSSSYDDALVSWHMWMAITLTFVSFALWVRHFSGRIFDRTGKWLGVVLFVLITITGHLGGSLTHGEDYLIGALHSAETPAADIPPIANVQEAPVYDSIVKPILAAGCIKCHGPSKQKGGLRMDSPEGIAKGGKDGAVLVTGKADSSELIRVLSLPLSDDQHMPPKGQRQLSRDQQAILSWWIDQGADYRKKVKELAQPENIHGPLAGLQTGQHDAAISMLAPEENVSPADGKDVKALKDAGIVVRPVAQGSNYLTVNFGSIPAARWIELLLPLKKQVVQLDLTGTGATDSSMEVVRQCAALRMLNLSNTAITDKSVTALAALKELRVLNLVGTSVTAQGLLAMQPPAHLHALYLYRTKVDPRYWQQLKGLFKGTVLDSGGYTLEKLGTDTAVVRPVRH